MTLKRIAGTILATLSLVTTLIFVSCLIVSAQEASATATPVRKPSSAKAPAIQTGSIEGVITDDDGKPLPDARVYVLPIGGQKRSRSASADETGKFRLLDLPFTMYRIFANAPSFVMPRDQMPLPGEPERYYRPGEVVNLGLIKGGVITGTVTDRTGEPLVGISVQAIRLPDADEREDSFPFDFIPRPHATDDRGIFRIYGLNPGRYVVLAGGNFEYSFRQTPYDPDAPTFYPSSTRDTAGVVTVQSGQEASGIDIHYRNEPGLTVSGRVTGAATKNIQLLMTVAGNSTPVTTTSSREQDGSFSFTGVANGEYKITARGMDDNFKPAGSGSGNVSVKGADITGLVIKLAQLSSFSGRVQFVDKPEAGCDPKSPSVRGLIVVSLTRLKKNDPTFLDFGQTETAVDPQGNFGMTGFVGGTFRLRTVLPEDRYIGSISRSTAKPANSNAKTPRQAPPVQSGPPELVSIGNGENVSDLTVFTMSGAGSAAGSLYAANTEIGVPTTLRLVLVPVEKERMDDTLRYAESVIDTNGTFNFRNLAPGNYRLVSRVIPVDPQNVPRPLAWDAKERARLLHDANAGSVPIEIKPCQKLSGLGLVFGQDGSVKLKAN